MGELFGEVHRLNVKTIQEAMNAIDTLKGGLRTYLTDCTENGIEFTVQKGEEFMDYDNLAMELGKDDIIISPVPAGSASDIVKTIIGILLIVASFFVPGLGPITQTQMQAALFTVGVNLALMGIIEMTMDEPEELDEQNSTLFNGPINNTKSGIPVPLAYGELEVGGAVVNFGFTDYRIKGNAGYEFVSKGTATGTGTSGTGGAGSSGGTGGSDSTITWSIK